MNKIATLLNYLNGISHDKLLHFAVCTVLSAILHLIFPAWVVVSIMVILSCAKEVYDQISGEGTPEWKDLIADAIGIIIGIL